MEHKPSSRILDKVTFRFDPMVWHGQETETMWAELVGRRRYRLDNIPFYVRGVSLDDIVSVEEQEGELIVVGVPARGGHSTYRLFLTEGTHDLDALEQWQKLQVLGCTYEGVTDRLFAVDVPPHANIHAVYEILEHGEAVGKWHFEEGHCGHSLHKANEGEGT